VRTPGSERRPVAGHDRAAAADWQNARSAGVLRDPPGGLPHWHSLR